MGMAMSRADRASVLGVLLLSAVVPGTLALLAPFAEERATLGIVAGWGLALLVMVPGWLLVARAMVASGGHAFVRAFLGASLLRLLLTVTGVVTFALAVPQAPLFSFLLAFFVGYASLTVLELRHTLPRAPRESTR